MINPTELKAHSFFESHCWAKAQNHRLLRGAVERHKFRGATLLKVASLDFAEDDELIKEIKADYDFIRAKLIKRRFRSFDWKRRKMDTSPHKRPRSWVG